MGNRNSLGDYINPLYHQQTIPPVYRGPLTSPVTGPPVPCDMARLCYLLESLPTRQFNENHERGILRPREATSFLRASNGPITVNSTTVPVVVAEYTMPERFAGFLEAFAVQCYPDSAAQNVLFTLKLDNNVLPGLNAQKLNGSLVADLIPFMTELVQKRKVSLQATLAVGSPGTVDVVGRLFGWQEYLTPIKPFGSTAASGLA